MIDKNSKITFSVSAATIGSVLSYGAYWANQNLATKSDIDTLRTQLTTQYIELRLTTEEDNLRFYEEKIASGDILPPNLQRRYEQTKKSVDRLMRERDKMIGMSDG